MQHSSAAAIVKSRNVRSLNATRIYVSTIINIRWIEILQQRSANLNSATGLSGAMGTKTVFVDRETRRASNDFSKCHVIVMIRSP